MYTQELERIVYATSYSRFGRETRPLPPYTPWRTPDFGYRFDESGDVMMFTTPSHGGFHVTGDALLRIPEAHRVGFAGRGWFEEDCDWAIVVHFLPELFDPRDVEMARETLRHWHPEINLEMSS